MKLKCPECMGQVELDSNGLIAWCEHGHVYRLTSAKYPCDVNKEKEEEQHESETTLRH